ncbi:MAG: hypothetical protein ACI9MR_001554 [Myxococcota bacterium]|jgi:hypothetical protein
MEALFLGVGEIGAPRCAHRRSMIPALRVNALALFVTAAGCTAQVQPSSKAVQISPCAITLQPGLQKMSIETPFGSHLPDRGQGHELGGELYDRPNGYGMFAYDDRPATLRFIIDQEGLQGGGPTWMGLVTAALALESPTSLRSLSFDDQSDNVLITSASKADMLVAQACFKKLVLDRRFLQRCLVKARQDPYFE